MWPGQHLASSAESSRSPEVHGLWAPGQFCVARAAFSELRGVLAESGVLRRGVRVSNLPGLCKVFVSCARPTRDSNFNTIISSGDRPWTDSARDQALPRSPLRALCVGI